MQAANLTLKTDLKNYNNANGSLFTIILLLVFFIAIATFKSDEDCREENEGKYSDIFNQIIF